MIESNYERVTINCEICAKSNVYNRVTDLGTVEPVDDLEVSCQHCGAKQHISGDSINPAFEMLLLDCYPLLESKQYMYCLLNICQSYEMFFSLYFRSRLYRAWSRTPDLDELNRLLEKLGKQTEDFTFAPLRCNFLRLASENYDPSTLDEANSMIKALDKNIRDASKIDLSICADSKIRKRLEKVKNTDVHKMRNKVVHGFGYRPQLAEVKQYLKDARDVLFVMPKILGVIDDDLNMYRKGG